jgi:hypothetical protein
MSQVPFDTENINFTDCPPIPLLYVEGMSANIQKKICLKYSLIAEEIERGYLLSSSETKKNYKFSFLDLFFSGLEILKSSTETSFFIFEKNQLREMLEVGIAESVSKESSLDFQIQQWIARRNANPGFPEFSFSGFAQATFYQVGFFPSIQQDVVHLNYDQMMLTMARSRQNQLRESA